MDVSRNSVHFETDQKKRESEKKERTKKTTLLKTSLNNSETGQSLYVRFLFLDKRPKLFFKYIH